MSKAFAKYDTRGFINKGARLELADPFTGEATGDWIGLRYSLADDYTAAREAVERSEVGGAEGIGSVERNARMLAPLIAEWSFSVPCTPANVYEFLCVAPHVHGEIIREATLEGKLYAKPVMNSASGRAESSPSTESPQDQATE